MSDLANQQAAISQPTDVLKDFYVFEFLDLQTSQSAQLPRDEIREALERYLKNR